MEPGQGVGVLQTTYWNAAGLFVHDVKQTRLKRDFLLRSARGSDIICVQEAHVSEKNLEACRVWARSKSLFPFVNPARISGTDKKKVSLGGLILVTDSFKSQYDISHHILVPHFCDAILIKDKITGKIRSTVVNIYFDSTANTLVKTGQMRLVGAHLVALGCLFPGAWTMAGGDFNYIDSPSDRQVLSLDGETMRDGNVNKEASKVFNTSVAQPQHLREMTQEKMTLISKNKRFAAKNDRVYSNVSEGAVLCLRTSCFLAARAPTHISDHSPVTGVISVSPKSSAKSLPKIGIRHPDFGRIVKEKYDSVANDLHSIWHKVEALHLAFWESAVFLQRDSSPRELDKYARYEVASSMFKKLACPPPPPPPKISKNIASGAMVLCAQEV